MQPTRFPNPGMAAHRLACYCQLRGSAALQARRRATRHQVRAGAGNHRRSDVGGARREAGSEETQEHESEPYASCASTTTAASCASTTTAARHHALRAATVLQRLPADVLTVLKKEVG